MRWIFALALAIALASALVSIGCSSGATTDPVASDPEGGRINLDDFSVGQQNRYVRWTGNGYTVDTADAVIEYETDTMIVSVVAVTDQGAIIEERLSAGSSSRENRRVEYPDSIFRYRYAVTGDTLRIVDASGAPARSRIVMAYRMLNPDQDALPLRAEGERIAFRGWAPASFRSENRLGYVEGHQQLGRSYARLGVIIDNMLMGTDHDGRFVLTSRVNGIVRSVRSSAWFDYSIGWDLL